MGFFGLAIAVVYLCAFTGLVSLLFRIGTVPSTSPAARTAEYPQPPLAANRNAYREWLRKLRAYHAALLAEIRTTLAHSSLDLPRLAKRLLLNRVQFGYLLRYLQFRFWLRASSD